jgi:23S rRNA (adenine2503-C2)-methyltransferase
MGILRNLCADEIIAQVVFALRITRLNDLPPITHVVFMGMGEPADNVDAVVKAAQQLTTRELFQLSRSKVTISTVAPSPEVFERLAQANVMLAWSVHASEDGLRKRLVPTTKHTMAELRRGLISALKTRHPTALRTLMVEVALMEDINDRMEDADHLAQFLSTILVEVPGSKLAVNLIPFNDTGHPTYKTPSLEAVSNFQKRLWEHGIAAFVRTTRGDDESSACGQLATTKKPKD